jgi:molecular chaperone GrpE (heat shock protein)
MSDERDEQVRVVDRRWWAREAGTDQPEQPSSTKPTYVDLEKRLADVRRSYGRASPISGSKSKSSISRGRAAADVAKDIERGRRALLADFLDVLDNLDRALTASRDAGDSADGTRTGTLVRGVELVREQFRQKLQAAGVTPIAALGSPFDATQHDAVSMAPVDDSSQDGIVVAVVKEGYAVGNEILRPASVVVGKIT